MKSLKIILPIGLVLFVVTGIMTHSIRKDAEKRLDTEEMVTAGVNRFILAEQDRRANFERELRQAQREDEFKDFMESTR